MIFEYSKYSKYLGDVLRDRQKTNPSYSMRAMAKHLELSPTTLSDVLKGRKQFSERTAESVAAKLKLTGRKARYFHALVQFETTKNDDLRMHLLSQLKVLNPQLREHFEIDLDQFRMMSDWYHTAIMEMTFLDEAMTPENISRHLEITVTQARDAVALLKKLGLLEEVSADVYRKTKNQFRFHSDRPNQAIRKFHHQMIGKAQESLQTQTPAEKFVGSETIPFNVEDLSEASDVIETCFQRLLEISNRPGEKSHVYHAGIQLFQLTKDMKKRVSK